MDIGLGELARLIFVGNSILDRVSTSVKLNRRSVLALVLLSLSSDDGEKASSNKKLKERFLAYSITSEVSAQKDVSAAKSELLDHGYITIGKKTAIFELSNAGWDIVGTIHKEIDKSVADLKLSEKERKLLREILGDPVDGGDKKPPKSEADPSSAPSQRKSG
jgi:hypothetical protein